VHSDRVSAEAARSVNALAFTVGQHVIFGEGQYVPGTASSNRVLVHELVHTLQQPGSDVIARLEASMCSSGAGCDTPDGSTGPRGSYTLTVYADKEGTFLGVPFTHKVGHSWLNLVDESGTNWSYGFWPQEGYDASNMRDDVKGCVHHPDGKHGNPPHTPTGSQTFNLTATEFSAAKAEAVIPCKSQPAYNLFGLQCTEYVRRVLAAAGKAPRAGFGLIWESPNALNSWIGGNALLLGINVMGATNAPGGQGTGTVGLDLAYRYHVLSILGNKLRLDWESRGELSSRIAGISTGIGVELTSQRVFLPSISVFGGGIAGELGPGRLGARGEGVGAGFTGGAGLNFNIDEITTVGVEYNVIKDLVRNDPELQRLLVTARIRF
jgi:hypothetical protein